MERMLTPLFGQEMGASNIKEEESAAFYIKSLFKWFWVFVLLIDSAFSYYVFVLEEWAIPKKQGDIRTQ